MTPPLYDLATRNHLLVTDSLVISGEVRPCPRRLADLVGDPGRTAFTLHDAHIRSWDAPDESRVERIVVPRHAVLLAHEYVAMSGDPHLRAMHDHEPRNRALIRLRSGRGIRVSGRIAADAVEDESIHVLDPRLESDAPAAAEFALAVSRLPYLLVMRHAVEAIAYPGGGSR